MKLILLALLVASVAADGDVLQLTKNNFDSTLKSSDIILVKFYAPWCGHCKKLAPEYEKAATQLKKDEYPVLLGEVDATVDSELAQKYGVTGYPTLKIFRKGVESPYNGPRDAPGIVKYMRSQAGPAARSLKTVSEFKKFVDHKQDVSVVAFLSKGSVAERIFLEFANSQREEFRMAVVYESELVKEVNEGKVGKVVVYRNVDGEDKKVQSADADLSSVAKLTDFIFNAAVPFSGFYRSSLAKRYEKIGLPRVTLCAVVDDVNDRSKVKYYANRMRKAGAALKGKILFVVEPRSEKECSDFGFDSVENGLGVVSKGQRFKMEKDQKFSVESVKELAEEFLAGNVPKHIKSEPTPEKNDEPVRILTGKSFEEEVTNSDKDVFITFYAPWCGHCKSLHPKWDELAKKMEKYSSQLMIAKMDATANEFPPQFQVQGFPTIYFSKANDRAHPVKYSGEREVAAFEKWLGNQVSRKLTENKSEL